jgi:RNA polymerase sporulation-specific sigma factor
VSDHLLPFDGLVDAYQPVVRGIVADYFIVGAQRDDLVQAALIGLWQAQRDFEPLAGVAFRSFAQGCMRRQVITAVKTSLRRKHAVLTGADRFERRIGGTDDDWELGETIADGRPSAYDRLVAGETLATILEAFHGMTAIEQCALIAQIDGDTYETAARALGTTTKAIDNALQRVRRKLTAAMEAA